MARRSLIAGIAVVIMFAVVSWGFAQQAQPKGQGKPGMQRPMMKLADDEMTKKDEEMISARVGELAKKLNLTPQQQAKVREIFEKSTAQIRVLANEFREKAMALMQQNREAVRALLTPEQKPKLEKMSQEPGQAAPAPQPPVKEKK